MMELDEKDFWRPEGYIEAMRFPKLTWLHREIWIFMRAVGLKPQRLRITDSEYIASRFTKRAPWWSHRRRKWIVEMGGEKKHVWLKIKRYPLD